MTGSTPTCLSLDGHASVSPDGLSLAEVGAGCVRIRDVHEPSNATPLDRRVAPKPLQVLGMAKQGRALWVSPEELSVLTDASRVTSIDVGALRAR